MPFSCTEDSNTVTKKCGEIIITIKKNAKNVYSFNCSFCDTICIEMINFSQHLEREHASQLEQTPTLNIDDHAESVDKPEINTETVMLSLPDINIEACMADDIKIEHEQENYVVTRNIKEQDSSPKIQDSLEPTENIYGFSITNPDDNVQDDFIDSKENRIENEADVDMQTFSDGDNFNMSLPNFNRFSTRDFQAIPQYNIGSSQGFSNLKEVFEEKHNELNSTIQKLHEIVVNQNEIIMKALAEQKMLAERVLHQKVTNNNVRTVFPIKSLSALIELNNTISEDNHNLYVNMMKSLLKGRLSKTLTEVISMRVCMEINIDGIHGKKRLKDFKAFFQALTDACRLLGSSEVEKDIRAALRVIKKRQIHAECIKNKKIKKEDIPSQLNVIS